MTDVLLDTNIVIYLTAQREKYVRYLESLGEKRIGISVVSYMELLVGVRSDEEAHALTDLLSAVEIIPLTEHVARHSAETLRRRTRRSLKDPKLADTIIAHTALSLGVPLLTNNPKDFAAFSELSLLVP